MRVTKEQITKSSNGITLIALIITIIVMLILVAVTITTAVDGGLFGKASMVGKQTNEAIAKEQELASGRLNIANVWYDSISDYIKNKPSANQGVNSNGKYLVDCSNCEGKKFIPMNERPWYDENGTPYCEIHGVHEEWISEVLIRFCSDCKKYVKVNNDECSNCGKYIENDYDGYDIMQACLLCFEEGNKKTNQAWVCEDCNGTGLMEVNCIKCLDTKNIHKKYCVECKSTNIITEYEYEYGYMCPNDCFDSTYNDPGPIICDDCGATVNYYYKELVDEYEICADCGGEVEEDYMDCPVCVHFNCTRCRDNKTIWLTCCVECGGTDFIEKIVDLWYECDACFETTSTLAEDGRCPYCEDGILNLVEDIAEVCANHECGSMSIEEREVACPNCSN